MNSKTKTIDILLIDDNPDDVYLTKLAASESNINANFQVVDNGKTAIQLLENLVSEKEELPDLILLDINLPLLNGLEVLKQFRSNDSIKSIPAVVFTSSDSVSDMKYSYENGADLFIRKPNNISDFREVILYIRNHYIRNFS